MNGIEDRVAEQAFFRVELRADGIVWLRRNAVAYATLEDVNRAYDELLALVDDWSIERRLKGGVLGTRARMPMGWLYDVRDAPEQRNDPEFGKVIQERRPDLLARSFVGCRAQRRPARP